MQLDVKIIAASFVFIGAVTFYVSSLISGHNIYKDFPQALTTLITSVVGFLIFALSPISIVLISITTVNSRNIDLLFDYKIFMPFLLNGIGLGVVAGCMFTLKARRTILDVLRDESEMKFRIYSYDLGWDNLLSKIKPEGLITLFVDNKIIKGKLLSYSVKQEPKQVVLSNYTVIDDSDKSLTKIQQKGRILITETSQIKRIAVPPESLNRHYDNMDHSTQAFYMFLAFIGFTLLFWSFNLSLDYSNHYTVVLQKAAEVSNKIAETSIKVEEASNIVAEVTKNTPPTNAWKNFNIVTYFLSEIFIFASLLAMFLSYKVSWRDYHNILCHLIMLNFAPITLLIFAAVSSNSIYHTICHSITKYTTWHNTATIIYIVFNIFMLKVYYYIRIKQTQTKRILLSIVSKYNNNEDKWFRMMLDDIYTRRNLNSDDEFQYNNFKTEMKQHYSNTADLFFNSLEEFVNSTTLFSTKIFAKEELNLIGYIRHRLALCDKYGLKENCGR
ncbi:hypothetical protein BROC_00380 [Candidatus Brocadiaceae bacterium]|nr:hypothetical protein BROC_00380 [Candidatus Brocadiaceae bacterium]